MMCAIEPNSCDCLCHRHLGGYHMVPCCYQCPRCGLDRIKSLSVHDETCALAIRTHTDQEAE
jgi:hypothetical protein